VKDIAAQFLTTVFPVEFRKVWRMAMVCGLTLWIFVFVTKCRNLCADP
jgi:hypothetical protein